MPFVRTDRWSLDLLGDLDTGDLRECIVGNEEMSHHISVVESDKADMHDFDEPYSTIRSQEGKNVGAFSNLFRK